MTGLTTVTLVDVVDDHVVAGTLVGEGHGLDRDVGMLARRLDRDAVPLVGDDAADELGVPCFGEGRVCQR